MLLRIGPDEPAFTPEYVDHQINAMKSPVLRNMAIKAKPEFFEARRRKQEADERGWKDEQRQALKQGKLSEAKFQNTVKVVIREPEFKQLAELDALGWAGDQFAIAEIKRISQYWAPAAQEYEKQGKSTKDAIRLAWQNMLRTQKINLGPSRSSPIREQPKATAAAAAPKPKSTFTGALSLDASFEQNLSKRQERIAGGYCK